MQKPTPQPENMEQLKKLAKVFNADNIITSDEINQVLEGIASILLSYKESTTKLNDDTRKMLNSVLSDVEKAHTDGVATLETKKTDSTLVFDQKLSEIKTLIDEVKAMKAVEPKPGEPGKDADEERIISEVIDTVMKQIKLPTHAPYELMGENIISSINALNIDDEDLKIDWKHIKNVPKNFGTAQNQWVGSPIRYFSQMEDFDGTTPATNGQVPIWNATTKKWTPGAAGGGGGGTPGGSDTQMQFNDGGSAFGGTPNLTYNKTSGAFTFAGTTDTTQWIFRNNATQTASNPMFLFTDSGGTELGRLAIRNDGSVGIGFGVLNAQTTGENIGIGRLAGRFLTNGSNNILIGRTAGGALNGGGQNIFIGQNAGLISTSGNTNTIIGDAAGINMGNASDNVALGSNALGGVALQGNTAIGTSALAATTGQRNSALGHFAGSTITSGTYNVVLGAYVAPPSNTASGQLNIGNVIYAVGMYATAASSSTPMTAGNVGIGIAASTTATMTLRASTTAISSLNIPSGTAPTSPVNGDIWQATNHVYMRLNGVTYQLDQQGGGSGTVTNTGGNLTADSLVLGAGTVDTKVVAGITTDGVSQINLGVNTTTLGKIKMFGNTSGDATIQPAAVAGTATVLTLPASTDTLVGRATTDTMTNKTLTSPVLTTPVLGTPSSGTLTNCTGLPISGLVNSTSTALGVGSLNVGHATDTTIGRVSAGVISVEGVTIPSVSSTDTLSNKRITKRTGTTTSSATPTINTDTVDFYSITALTVDITSMTTNLSGTPTEGQTLWIAITGTAARAITWGASFEASTIALPTTTVTTNRLDIGFVWNTVTSKWRCVATC